jgi:hypothetical protein
MSSGPERRFTVALVVALSVVSIACGSASESSLYDSNDPNPTPPNTLSGASPRASCVPSVALGDPVAAPLPSFACPSGWEARAKSNALLVSGRFGTAEETVAALCTQSDDSQSTTSAGEPAGIGIDIDFDANDVLAVAHDGEVALHARGGDLWLRHTETCDGSYRTALFVVPKNRTPLEQTCSTTCE